jgi:hypothetical protein
VKNSCDSTPNVTSSTLQTLFKHFAANAQAACNATFLVLSLLLLLLLLLLHHKYCHHHPQLRLLLLQPLLPWLRWLQLSNNCGLCYHLWLLLLLLLLKIWSFIAGLLSVVPYMLSPSMPGLLSCKRSSQPWSVLVMLTSSIN